jgi:hypothetical protein
MITEGTRLGASHAALMTILRAKDPNSQRSSNCSATGGRWTCPTCPMPSRQR